MSVDLTQTRLTRNAVFSVDAMLVDGDNEKLCRTHCMLKTRLWQWKKMGGKKQTLHMSENKTKSAKYLAIFDAITMCRQRKFSNGKLYLSNYAEFAPKRVQTAENTTRKKNTINEY